MITVGRPPAFEAQTRCEHLKSASPAPRPIQPPAVDKPPVSTWHRRVKQCKRWRHAVRARLSNVVPSAPFAQVHLAQSCSVRSGPEKGGAPAPRRQCRQSSPALTAAPAAPSHTSAHPAVSRKQRGCQVEDSFRHSPIGRHVRSPSASCESVNHKYQTSTDACMIVK